MKRRLIALVAVALISSTPAFGQTYHAREILSGLRVGKPSGPVTPPMPEKKASCTLLKDHNHANDVGSSNIGSAVFDSYEEVLTWCETSFSNIKLCDAYVSSGKWYASAYSKGTQRPNIVGPPRVYYGGVCTIL